MTWVKRSRRGLRDARESDGGEQRERALSKTWAPSSKDSAGRTKKSRCSRHRQPHIASENYHPTGTFLITPLRDSTFHGTPSTLPSIYRPTNSIPRFTYFRARSILRTHACDQYYASQILKNQMLFTCNSSS